MKFTNLKRGAVALAMAGLMAGVVLPASALAETVSASDTTGMTITKSWTTASEQQYEDNKDLRFTFQLKYTGKTQLGTNELKDPEAMTIGSAVKTVQNSDWTGSGISYTSSVDLLELLAGVNFTTPGIYDFELSEVNDGNSNVTYDDATYTVRVEVAWETDGSNQPTDKLEIKSVWFHDAAGKKSKAASFSNDVVASSDVTVSKVVSGMAANTNEDFSFSVTLNGITGTYTWVDAHGVEHKVTADPETHSATFSTSLKHGDSFTIKNLPDTATYSVSETDTDAYTENYTLNGTDFTESNSVSNLKVAENVEVTFKNVNGWAADTGITMNVIPAIVAGGVAAAGAVTLVISRKRRAGEDF